jgi:hypothetical protein
MTQTLKNRTSGYYAVLPECRPQGYDDGLIRVQVSLPPRTDAGTGRTLETDGLLMEGTSYLHLRVVMEELGGEVVDRIPETRTVEVDLSHLKAD